jgi:hypothetical protein
VSAPARLLVMMDKMGPPLRETRGEIETLMTEHKCEAVPASAGAPSAEINVAGPDPAADPAPDPDPEPDAE